MNTTFAEHINMNKISCPKDKIKLYGHYIRMDNSGTKNDGIFVDDNDGKLLKIRCSRSSLNRITPNVKHLFPEIHDVFEISYGDDETENETENKTKSEKTCVVMEYVNGGDLSNFLFLAYPRSKLSENHKKMFDDFSFLYNFMDNCYYDDILFPTIFEIYSDDTEKSFEEKVAYYCKNLINRCVIEVLENDDEYCYSRQVVVKTMINGEFVTYSKYFGGELVEKLCELENDKENNDNLMKWVEGVIENIFVEKITEQYYYCAKMFDLFNKGYTLEMLNKYHNEYKKHILDKVESVEEQLMKNFVTLYKNDLMYHDFKSDNFGVRLRVRLNIDDSNNMDDFEILFLDVDSGLCSLVSIYREKESLEKEYRHYHGVLKMCKFMNDNSSEIYCLQQLFLCSPYIEDMFKNNDTFNFLKNITEIEGGNNFC